MIQDRRNGGNDVRANASGPSPAGDDAATQQVRVLIVEDHLMFAQALRSALDDRDDIAVTDAVDTVAGAVAAVEETTPDVVLMDYRLPDGDGVEAARQIIAVRPATRVVMLSATADDNVLREAIQAGCSGYITKSSAIDELILAVRAAHRGEALISPAMLSRLVERAGDRTRVGSDLTGREVQVLRLLAEGYSNQAIATQLDIRLATVRNHVQSIIEKLQAHSKLEAVSTSLRLGLIQPPR